MADPNDYSDAAGVFQKAMQDALANLDKAAEDVRKEHEKAIDLQIEAHPCLFKVLPESTIDKANCREVLYP